MSIQANKLMNLADGKVLYDDLRDRIETMIDNIAAEDTATATAAHAVNDVITVGGKLYKVTAAIAIGDTITDTGNGANVTGTTLSALIAVVATAVAGIDLTGIIDDTAGDGDTNKVYSADKVHDLLAAKANSSDVPDTSLLAPKESPSFTGSIRMGSNNYGTVGDASTATGKNLQATGECSHAEGYGSIAAGTGSHAEGKGEANGAYSHAEGEGTEANGRSTHAGGKYNIEDEIIQAFASNTYYSVGNVVYTVGTIGTGQNSKSVKKLHMCLEDHTSGESLDASKWTEGVPFEASSSTYGATGDYSPYAEIIGGGYRHKKNNIWSTNFANIRMLDWGGNERLNGRLLVDWNKNVMANGDNSITIGSTTLTEANLQALLAMLT